jgi:hypothetical protein
MSVCVCECVVKNTFDYVERIDVHFTVMCIQYVLCSALIFVDSFVHLDSSGLSVAVSVVGLRPRKCMDLVLV